MDARHERRCYPRAPKPRAGCRVVEHKSDYQTLSKPNRDGYELFLGELFKTNLSGPAHALARVSFVSTEGEDVCRVDVGASARPVFARGPDGKEHNEFWARVGNSTRQLFGSDMVQYQQDHWD